MRPELQPADTTSRQGASTGAGAPGGDPPPWLAMGQLARAPPLPKRSRRSRFPASRPPSRTPTGATNPTEPHAQQQRPPNGAPRSPLRPARSVSLPTTATDRTKPTARATPPAASSAAGARRCFVGSSCAPLLRRELVRAAASSAAGARPCFVGSSCAPLLRRELLRPTTTPGLAPSQVRSLPLSPTMPPVSPERTAAPRLALGSVVRLARSHPPSAAGGPGSLSVREPSPCLVPPFAPGSTVASPGALPPR